MIGVANKKPAPPFVAGSAGWYSSAVRTGFSVVVIIMFVVVLVMFMVFVIIIIAVNVVHPLLDHRFTDVTYGLTVDRHLFTVDDGVATLYSAIAGRAGHAVAHDGAGGRAYGGGYRAAVSTAYLIAEQAARQATQNRTAVARRRGLFVPAFLARVLDGAVFGGAGH